MVKSTSRGVYLEGDSLSPLLFVISMIPLTMILRKEQQGYCFKSKEKVNHLLYMDDVKLFAKSRTELESLLTTVKVFSSDIRMEFGIDKCAVLVLKRGKICNDNQDMILDDGEVIKAIDQEKPYKYLGVLECSDIKQQEMKEKIEREYFRRMRKVLRSKLNAGNMITAANTWAVSLFRYGSGIVQWNKQELQSIDRKSRKLLTIHGALHPRSDVDRIYVKRPKGGRGLMSVEDVVRCEEHSLARYVRDADSEILGAASKFLKEVGDEGAGEMKDKQEEKKVKAWEEKPMHGQHVRQTREFMATESWQWLIRGSLKRETEAMLVAAQDQALGTNYRKAKIKKTRDSALCRMCKNKDETVSHIISECSKIAQNEYKNRHDRVATAVHWGLCKKYQLPHTNNWYDHRAEPVTENEEVKLLWDFSLRTDKVIEARRPDIVLVDKIKKSCIIIDVAVPGDTRVFLKEEEKMDKYRELSRELQRLWQMNTTTVIPVVVGALGTITERLRPFLAMLGIAVSFETIQKASLLGTAHILRKVLEIKD